MDALYFDDHVLKRFQSLKSDSGRELGSDPVVVAGQGGATGGLAADTWPSAPPVPQPSAPFLGEEEEEVVVDDERGGAPGPLRSGSMDMSTMFDQLRLDGGDVMKRSNSEGRYPALRQEVVVKKPVPPPPKSEVSVPAAPFAPPRSVSP